MSISIPKASLAVLIFLGVQGSALVQAQDSANMVVIGERVELESKILGEIRELQIGKPASYDEGDEEYAVLYLLDGDTHFHHTTASTKFLAAVDQIPELLVVAIPNTDRLRDLSPPTETEPGLLLSSIENVNHGFLRFLEEELIPWVDQNYRTRSHRILVGHSAGGTFAINTLMTNSELFESYIAISPSLYSNDHAVTKLAEGFFKSTERLKADLFLTVGDENFTFLQSVRQLAATLDGNAPEEFRWDFIQLPGEGHNSVTHRATYLGLEFVYDGWLIKDYWDIINKYGVETLVSMYENSLERFEDYDRILPDGLYFSIMGNLIQQDRLEEAEAAHSILLQKMEPTVEALAAIHDFFGRTYSEKGEIGKAIEYFREALELNPESDSIRRDLEELEARQ